MNNRKNIIFAAVVIALLVGTLFLMHQEPEKKSLARTDALMAVTVVSPQEKTLQNTVRLTGMIVPREDIVITSELSSVLVQDVLKDEGMIVEKDDVLATLDPATLQTQLDEMEAKFKEAEINYTRVKKVANTGAISPDSVDQKRSLFATAKAQFENAKLNVKRTQVKAPVAGLIYERTARIGSLIGGTDPLFRIAKDGLIEMEAFVSEDDLPKLTIDQAVQVTLIGHEEPVAATIRLIAPRLDPNTRTARIRIALPEGVNIAIGTFAEVMITVEKRTGNALPQTAIMTDDNGNFVWVLDGKNAAHKIPVHIDMRSDKAVLITAKDLPNDARVVAKAGAFLNEGDSVTVTDTTKTDKK